MGIDASIYNNSRPIPINIPSPLQSAQQAMTLSTLGMQQQQMQYQMQQQQALRQAYAQNTGPDGKLDQQGFLSQLGQTAPQAAMEAQGQFAKLGKEQADAQAAQAEAAHKHLSVVIPAYGHLLSLPDDQAAQAYQGILKQLAALGVPVNNAEPVFDRAKIQQEYDIGSQMKEQLDNRATQAGIDKTQAETGKIPSEIAKNWSEVGLAPVKRAGEMFGRSSPNATVSNQYSDDPAVKSAKTSQVAMNQMLDAYRHPSPYSDESMALNAMKIKFPGAPDVGSLEEFKHAQGATDAMKNWLSQKLQGIKAPGAREDLMRDAVSTYIPNVASLRGAQKKYYQKAIGQGIPNAPDIFAEPGIDQTEADVRALDKELGPYKPPAERSGLLGSAAKMLGMGGNQSANASTKAPALKHGTVEDGYVYMGGDPGKASNWKKAR